MFIKSFSLQGRDETTNNCRGMAKKVAERWKRKSNKGVGQRWFSRRPLKEERGRNICKLSNFLVVITLRLKSRLGQTNWSKVWWMRWITLRFFLTSVKYLATFVTHKCSCKVIVDKKILMTPAQKGDSLLSPSFLKYCKLMFSDNGSAGEIFPS